MFHFGVEINFVIIPVLEQLTFMICALICVHCTILYMNLTFTFKTSTQNMPLTIATISSGLPFIISPPIIRTSIAIATAQLYSTRPKLRFCLGLNSADSVSEV